jgi:CTP-dependent riboflavin kinase
LVLPYIVRIVRCGVAYIRRVQVEQLTKVQGIVCSGCGRANLAFTEERMQEIYNLVGWWAYPGTLNVRVLDLPKVITNLGTPLAETEHATRIGPLRWWSGRLELSDDRSVNVLAVRGVNSGMRNLELVASLPLRFSYDLRDGDRVWFTPNGH